MGWYAIYQRDMDRARIVVVTAAACGPSGGVVLMGSRMPVAESKMQATALGEGRENKKQRRRALTVMGGRKKWRKRWEVWLGFYMSLR